MIFVILKRHLSIIHDLFTTLENKTFKNIMEKRGEIAGNHFLTFTRLFSYISKSVIISKDASNMSSANVFDLVNPDTPFSHRSKFIEGADHY